MAQSADCLEHIEEKRNFAELRNLNTLNTELCDLQKLHLENIEEKEKKMNFLYSVELECNSVAKCIIISRGLRHCLA